MKKCVCALIALIMSVSVLTACNNGDGVGNESKNQENESAAVSGSVSDESSEASEDGNKPYGWNLPVRDMDNREFRVLCREFGAGSASILGFNGEVIQRPDFDEQTADMVDIEKYHVRREIEDRYNCTITGELSSASQGDFNNIVKSCVLTGEPHYDMVFDAYGFMYTIIAEDMYADIASIDSIDLSNPWWDQNAVRDLSICKKLYFICGDINTYDNDGTWVIYYNKELAAKVIPDVNFYSLVENNEWTFDKFAQIVRMVSSDTDGVDGMSEFDTWGLGTESYNAFVHMLASGRKIAQKDENDVPYLDFQNDGMYTVMDKIMTFYSDNDNVLVANRFSGKYSNPWEETIIKAFRDGRELFYMGGLINMVGFRTIDFNFGILPIPKHTAEQDNYYHSVSIHNMSCLGIPATTDDYDDLGLIIEALGAESKNKVTPVYYDKCMKSMYVRDEEDEAMLDIIFDSRCFDLGSVFNWGGILGEFMNINTNFASRFDAIADAAQAQLEETLEYFRK